jgi:hypothetical protein
MVALRYFLSDFRMGLADGKTSGGRGSVVDQSRWEKRDITCPEGKGEGHLLVEWKQKRGKPVIESISCDNASLKDLSGTDCKWSCWKKSHVRTNRRLRARRRECGIQCHETGR